MLFLLLRVGKGSWPLPAVCKETADKVTAAGRALEEEAHATWVYTVGVRKRDREGKKVPVAGLELDFWLWLSPWSSRERITKKNSTSSLSHLTGQVLQPPSHLGAPLLNLHQFVNTCLVLGGEGGSKPDAVSGCGLTNAEQRERIPSPQQPVMLSTSSAARGGRWLLFSMLPTETPRAFSAEPSPSFHCHRGSLFLKCSLSSLNLTWTSLLVHSPHLSTSPWIAALPPTVYFPIWQHVQMWYECPQRH